MFCISITGDELFYVYTFRRKTSCLQLACLGMQEESQTLKLQDQLVVSTKDLLISQYFLVIIHKSFSKNKNKRRKEDNILYC